MTATALPEGLRRFQAFTGKKGRGRVGTSSIPDGWEGYATEKTADMSA